MVSMLSIVFAAVAVHTDKPVCRIYVIKGEASMVRGTQGRRTARLVESGFDGDELWTGHGSNTEIMFMLSGKRYRVLPDSHLRLQRGGFSVVSGVAPRAIETANASVTAVFNSVTPAAAVRIRGESASLLPSGGQLRSPSKIRWVLPRRSDTYQIEIYEETVDKLVFQKTVAENECQLPGNTVQPGSIYRLVLTAQRGQEDTEHLTRHFRILPDSELAAMNDALSALPIPAAGVGKTFALVERADIYEQFGCFADALKCLQEAAKARTSDSLDLKIAEIRRRSAGEE